MFLLWILFLFVTINASPNKLCINCKHFIPNGNPKYGKCSQYIIQQTLDKDELIEYLVTGISKELKIEYRFCSTVRYYEDMCGIEGKKYIPSDKL